VTDTALSESVVEVPDVWRLRARGCWAEAAAMLAPFCADDAGAALRRAELLVEGCFYQLDGWAEAEDALRTAEALASTDEERGAAASERGYLAYGATLFSVRDRADEARSAFGRSAALLSPASAGRPRLDFRRGLVAENIAGNPAAARAAYRRAHAGAVAHGDVFLTSFTWRHLAGLAAAEGELAEARHGFTESLRIRVSLGHLVGTAPALLALAGVCAEEEAAALRAEAARLYALLDGIPVWLAPALFPGSS
jgi:tetratricopeptide (TPR) repeat protein